MPIDDKTVRDMEHYIDMLEKLGSFLDRIYYDPSVATMSNKPIISMLETAADYLYQNLSQLKASYQARHKEVEEGGAE